MFCQNGETQHFNCSLIRGRVLSDKAPSFREAFAKRRCLTPADGFYEWRKTAKPNLPFAIAMKEGPSFTFAGLWEAWKDPESGDWLRTCTINKRAQ